MRDKLATRTPCANVAIKGMTTEQAARAIKDRLLELDGVVSVRMSITDSSARVEYEPSKIGPTHIGSCVGQMGYSYTVKSMLRTM
jgi:copper chaperone CopZ